MASEFDPDARVVKSGGGAVIHQGGNVSSRLPGRETFSGTPAQATQGGNQSSTTVQDLRGRVESATTTDDFEVVTDIMGRSGPEADHTNPMLVRNKRTGEVTRSKGS